MKPFTLSLEALNALTWTVPPECGGQIVQNAVASYPPARVYLMRETDRSLPTPDPDRVSYWYVWMDDCHDVVWEPWNRWPLEIEPDHWRPLTVTP